MTYIMNKLMRYICETYVTRYNYSPLHEEILLGDGDWSPIQGLEFSYGSDEDDSSTISELEKNIIIMTRKTFIDLVFD